MTITVIDERTVQITLDGDVFMPASVSYGGKVHKAYRRNSALYGDSIGLHCDNKPRQGRPRLLGATNVSRKNLCKKCFTDQAK
jgi:hypothetical protein